MKFDSWYYYFNRSILYSNYPPSPLSNNSRLRNILHGRFLCRKNLINIQQRKNSAQCKFKADTNAAPVNSIYRWPSINVSRFPIKIRPGRFSCKFEKSIMARRRFYPGRSINREESQSPWLSLRPLVKGCPLSMEMTMMMTTTDDYHHCGPRVRYLAATTIIYLDFGAVLSMYTLSLSVCTFCLFIIWSIMKQPRVKAIICTNRRFHYALFVSRAVARSLLQNSSELDDFCATPNDGSGAGPRRAERKLAGWNKPFHPNGESSRWSLSRERGCAWSGWRSSFCVALVSFYVSFLHMFENCQVLFYRSLFY